MGSMKRLRAVKTSYCILSGCIAALGLIFLIWPQLSLSVMCRISGCVLLVGGITKVVSYFTKDLYQLAFQFDLALGITMIVVSAAMIFHTQALLSVLTVCIGLFMLFDAALRVQTALDARRFGEERWWLVLVLSILVALAGILLMLMPFTAQGVILRIVGLNLVLDGALNFWLAKTTVKVPKDVPYEIVEEEHSI